MSADSPMIVVVWAAGLFMVAGVGFAKLAEDFSGGGGTYALLVAASAVALLALAAAAAPTAMALLKGRDVGAWKYVAVPAVGAAVWYGVLRVALALSAGHGVHSAPNVAGFLLIAVTGIAAVVATAWAAATVLRRVPAPQPVRLRRTAVIVVAGGMTVATVAALIWGLQARAGDPARFGSDHGILATPFVASWIVVVAALATATMLAVVASRRQLVAGR